MYNKSICIIGSGNLAWNLAIQLSNASIKINQIYSKNINHAKELGNKINISYTDKIEEISNESDIYIIAITDDALVSFSKNFQVQNKLVLHTCGSCSIEVLKEISSNYGVFYPLQSFVKYKEISFKEIPICIEANTEQNIQIVHELASRLSSCIYHINSKQREVLHISAVFACNFSNLMLSEAYEILLENDIDFCILKPLIAQTFLRISNENPFVFQTGPAFRGNNAIIEKQLEFLSKDQEMKKIYSILSERIKNKNNK